MRFSAVFRMLFLFTTGFALMGCRYLVDEDRRDCGGDCTIDCRLRLQTKMQTELATVLSLAEDQYVASSLRTWLDGLFADYASDVDISFYEPSGERRRLVHMRERMDGNSSVYTLYLPAREYLNNCVANIEDNDQVALVEDEHCTGALLRQYSEREVAAGLMPTRGSIPADTVHSHNTGLFSARKHILMQEMEDRHISIHLYMVNAASALVLDRATAGTAGQAQVYVRGFADAFAIADSTYRFASQPVVRTLSLPVEGGTEYCYASAHFPSKDEGEGAIWRWDVQVPLPDGSVTRSVLEVKEPLQAGCLKILKAKVFDNGVVSVTDPTVAVSVTLNWNQGSEHDVEM